MATLPLKASNKEGRSVIHFLWAKDLNANDIHSEICPVYGDNCVDQKIQQYMFGVRSLLRVEKVLLIRNELAEVSVLRPNKQLQQLILRC